MRIRRRPQDVLQPPPSPSSPGFPLPTAPPTSFPRGSSPSCSGAAALADVKPPPSPPPPPPPAPYEVDETTCEATALGPRLPLHRQDRQLEEGEGGDETTENRNKGAEDGAERHQDCPAQVSPSTKEEEGGERVKDEATVAICKKGDGKGWRCKREAQRGCSLCQYHLAKLRSYSRKKKRSEAATGSPPEAPVATIGIPLQRAAPRRKTTSDKELSESKGGILSGGFYYYSGFGPRWGKRRRGAEQDEVRGNAADDGASPADGHDDDGLDDAPAGAAEDDEHGRSDAAGDGKPWKSRSLSSLL